MASHYTRSKAHRPVNVEPDVAPVAASYLVSDITSVRPSVVAAGEPGSMAAAPDGPMSVPPSTLQREGLPPEADPDH